ncbi:MAG: hypothetical protein WCJ11_05985 [Methylococcaceae bacterium]
MKTKLQILALLASNAFVSGCSAGDVPGLSDVEPGLREVWMECKYNGKPQFEITDVKKTNGINHGRTYEIFVSYKITGLYDINNNSGLLACPNFAPSGAVNEAASKKGFTMNIDTNYIMIKSENGWVIE